jgi:acetyl/propionyl-CoA carboxylase alpha subunit
MHYKISTGETEFDVETAAAGGESGTINGKPYSLDLLKNGDQFHIIRDDRSYTVSLVHADYKTGEFRLRVNNREYSLSAKDRFDLLLEELGIQEMGASALNDLKAPMPGLVLDIPVKEGQHVSKGDVLVVLEAMKMENVLKAESDGIVKSINITKGEAVEKNFVLIEFEL